MTISPSQMGQSVQLHLVVIGAGLAGLAAAISTRLEGHRVTVLEKVAKLEEVGAGLQITPNGTRLLRYWGIFDHLAKKAAAPSYVAIRRYDGSSILASDDLFQEQLNERFENPLWDLHRADLQAAMVARARSLGVDIRLGQDVIEVDPSTSTVKTASGELFSADLVLGADGLWSRSRSLLLGKTTKPAATGDLAYRLFIDAKNIQDPELKQFITSPALNFWVGPNSHVVGYSIRQGQSYNLVLLTPDDLPEHVSKATGDVDEMRKVFGEWDPLLKKLLNCVDKVDKWRLMHLNPLDKWTNEDGSLLVAGDACHPMLPYLAQGANSSLEDGAALGRILGYVRSKDDIGAAVKMWEQLRKTRGEAIAKASLKQRDIFHLPDGPQQQERDALFACGMDGYGTREQLQSFWTCPTLQHWLFSYDAVLEADTAYKACPF